MNINFKVTAKVKVIYSHHLDSSTESPLCSWKPTCSRYKLRASKGQILGLRWPWAASFRKTECSSFNYCQNHGALWVSTASFLMPGWFLHFFFFALSSLIYPPCLHLGNNAEAATWGKGRWIQKHGLSGEIRLSASKALSCWRGDKYEKMNENTRHGKWCMRFEERGKTERLWWVRGGDKGFRRELEESKNGVSRQYLSQASVCPWLITWVNFRVQNGQQGVHCPHMKAPYLVRSRPKASFTWLFPRWQIPPTGQPLCSSVRNSMGVKTVPDT